MQWAHAMAPGANLLLVETPVAETEGVAGLPEIVQAENYVINHHLGQVISQSFGATEQTFPSVGSILRLRSAYINAYLHHVTVLAATGDAGATDYSDVAGTLLYTHRAIDWPSSDPLVTAVGGTQLQLTPAGQRTAPDQVWNDTYNTALNQVFFGDPGPNALATGGGKSVVFSRPLYQDGVAGVVRRPARGAGHRHERGLLRAGPHVPELRAASRPAGTWSAAPASPPRCSPGSWPWPTRWLTTPSA